MSRTHLACLAAVALAVAIGVHMGGRMGMGVVTGALLGGAVALFAHDRLARSLERELEDSLKAILAAFALKLCVLLAAFAVLAFVPGLDEVVAAPGLLLSFVGTALVLGAVGSLDHLRTLARAAAAPRASVTEPGDLLP